MSNRLTRGNKIASFLRGFTGFPFLRYRYNDSMLVVEEAPDDYWIKVTLDKGALSTDMPFIPMIRRRRHEKGISAGIWAYGAKDTDYALVVMPFGSFAELLKTHIECGQKARAEEGE